MKLKLSAISPEKVLEISNGEIKNDELLNYKSGLPYEDGLLCQKIFGPVRNYVCGCGKYNGRRYKGKTCEFCGVTVLSVKSRSDRMGHIDLQIPIVNPVVMEGLAKILDTNVSILSEYLRGQSSLYFNDLSESPKIALTNGVVGHLEFVSPKSLMTGIPNSIYCNSSAALYDLVKQIDLQATYLLNPTDLHRLYIDQNFKITNFFLRYLPVDPAAYRPVVKMDNFVSSDPKNDLYARVIRRSIRLKTILEYETNPAPLIEKECNMIFKSINDLFINGSQDGPSELPPIIDMFSGKTGLLRSNLLGKRVDYSGRSVITSAGDRVEIDQIGLPVKMAYTLFKPFILNHLIENYVEDYNEAIDLYDRKTPAAIASLKAVSLQRRVLLNRAPTLHRYGVLSFRVKLHNGKAILMHPMVCTPLNADFDGDCIHESVEIPLLSGENLTIPQMISKYGLGSEVWVYSYDKDTNKIVPAKAKILGRSGIKHDWIKINLENGASQICSPDHPWLLKDGSYKRAEDLTENDELQDCKFGDALAPFDIPNPGIYQIGSDYPEPIYTMVGKWMDSRVGKDWNIVVHHNAKDSRGNWDRNNNTPDALQILTRSEHCRIHMQDAAYKSNPPHGLDLTSKLDDFPIDKTYWLELLGTMFAREYWQSRFHGNLSISQDDFLRFLTETVGLTYQEMSDFRWRRKSEDYLTNVIQLHGIHYIQDLYRRGGSRHIIHMTSTSHMNGQAGPQEISVVDLEVLCEEIGWNMELKRRQSMDWDVFVDQMANYPQQMIKDLYSRHYLTPWTHLRSEVPGSQGQYIRYGKEVVAQW